MKKLFLLCLATMLALATFACSSTESTPPEPIDDIVEVNPYAGMYDGYWTITEENKGEGYILQNFLIDEADESWVSIDAAGYHSEMYFCSILDDEIVLMPGDFGEIYLTLQDGHLWYGDTMLYEKTEEISSAGTVMSVEGTWYHFGNLEGKSIVIESYGYTQYYQNGEIAEEGDWTISGVTRIRDDDEIAVSSLELQDPDAWFGTDFYVLDERLLLNTTNAVSSDFAEFYVHEDALAESNLYIDMGFLIINQWETAELWNSPEGISGIVFEDAPDKRVIFTETLPIEEGSSTFETMRNYIGNWDMPEVGVLHITFTDGTFEEIVYDGSSLYVDYLGSTFYINGASPEA